ncbi:MAG: hypothetical protein ABW252_24230, partial [Polyangiales bacterium]
MSTRTLLQLTSLACMLTVAGCDEPDPARDDDDVQDERDRPAPGRNPGTGSDDDDDDAAPRPGNGQPDAPAQSAQFFLPTGEPDNTSAPVLEVDGAGNTHAVYPAYAGGDAYYGFCSGGRCSGRDAVQMVHFTTDGTVGNVALALTPSGQPRVLLATSLAVYFGSCDASCGVESSWRFGQIMTLSEQAVTGETLALDPQGRPRFLVHGYRNPLYPFSPRHTDTMLARCDDACDQAASWTTSKIAEKEIWEGSTLRYDASGRAHVATFVYAYGESASQAVGAYLTCAAGCDTVGTWKGIGFLAPYESSTEAVGMKPAITMALTKAGAPRVAQILKTEEGKKRIAYFACDADCAGDNWTGTHIFEADAIHAGLDLALDAQDRPRLAHTMNYNVVLSHCDGVCTGENAKWDSTYVEKGSDIPADTIFLEWN